MKSKSMHSECLSILIDATTKMKGYIILQVEFGLC